MNDANALSFGRFQLQRRQRRLLRDSVPVELGARALDILLTLIDAQGAPVSKDELMKRVWPDVVIEENNLTVQISALRKALGPDANLVLTVARHGYAFCGEIRQLEPAQSKASKARPLEAGHIGRTNIPNPIESLIGRDQELQELRTLQASSRLLTLVGPGGIGKTRLALELGRRLLHGFPDGVWLAEFSSLADPGLVPATVAAAIRLELGGGDISAQRVARALAGRRLLLLMETCEHVIDAATALAESVLSTGAAVQIIATSREPLRSEGERVYRVPALPTPPTHVTDTVDILRHGAVQLFIARMSAADAGFRPKGGDLASIAAICRRLEGIPLAIELAAGRAALGLDNLLARLDDCFALLTGGRRTATPRHQALRATLDWSYQLLNPPERSLLCRVGIFAGPFSLDACSAVAAGPELAPGAILESLASLVAKSLVAAEVGGPNARYRLLDTIRAYALDRLIEDGERNRLARCHAEYYRDLFERAEAEWETQSTAEWLAGYIWHIDNLRAALNWAFSANGDASVGIALTAAAVPLWMHLSLVNERLIWFERALGALPSGPSADRRREMKLRSALGATLMLTSGRAPEGAAALAEALEIAESLGDVEYRLRSLSGLMFFNTNGGRHRRALELGEHFRTLAAGSGNANDVLFGERLMAISQHLLGDQTSAREHLERVFAGYIGSDHQRYLVRFQFDLVVGARGYLARVLWLLGFPDQAMQAVKRTIDDARATNHAVTLCFGLALAACPIARLAGDLDAAEHYADLLVDSSKAHGLALWHALGRLHHGLIDIERGDVGPGLELVRSGLTEAAAARFVVRLSSFPDAKGEAFARAGQIAEALAALTQEIEHLESIEEQWLIPELMRRKGELLLRQGRPDAAAAAEQHFRQAIDWARRQDALSWELRAATSLARLRLDQERAHEAKALLQPVYSRFTEGFDSADLKAVNTVLDSLPAGPPEN